MDKARIFDTDEIISADQIQSGIYGRDFSLVDPEENFEVRFVSQSYSGRKPHFRLYMPEKIYQSFSSERKAAYDRIYAARKESDSSWHKSWMERARIYNMEGKVFKDSSGRRIYVDAYDSYETAVEFKRSFNQEDFDRRNNLFLSNIIWLFDLTGATIRKTEEGPFEILQSTAKSFFRICDDPSNLRNHRVYIQTDEDHIYRISSLTRKQTEDNKKSTIWTFEPEQTFTPDQFMDLRRCKSIYELWDKKYYWMIVENLFTHKQIMIQRDPNNPDYMKTENGSGKGNLLIQYVTYHPHKPYVLNSPQYYSLWYSSANKKEWIMWWAIHKNK